MDTQENLYCKVFVDTGLARDDLLELIVRLAEGRSEWQTITARHFVADLRKNEEHTPAAVGREPHNFLYYPFILDVEPTADSPRHVYVAAVAALLRGLMSSDCRAVAACDFEEELPQGL